MAITRRDGPAAAVGQRGLGQDVGARRALRALRARGRPRARRGSSRSRSPTRPPASCASGCAARLRGARPARRAPATPRRAWISTFHGFCARLLRAHALARRPGPGVPRARGARGRAAARARRSRPRWPASWPASAPEALDLAAAYGVDALRGMIVARARRAAQPRPDAARAARACAAPAADADARWPRRWHRACAAELDARRRAPRDGRGARRARALRGAARRGAAAGHAAGAGR